MSLIDRLNAARLPEPDKRRSIRKASGASLRDVATELGVSPMTVLRWEQGQGEPRTEHAIAYRRLLDQLEEFSK